MSWRNAIQRRSPSTSRLELHISRLVIDAAVLGTMPADVLAEQLRQAFTSELPAETTARAPSLATRIRDAVAPRISERVVQGRAGGPHAGV